VVAQQSGSVAPANLTISKAREALAKAEAEHPENSPQVASALINLISAQRDTDTVDTATLPLSVRVLNIQKTIAGPRSKEYVEALGIQADVLMGLNRIPEARPLTEQALDIALHDFPNSTDTAVAAGTLARVCSSLGDFPCSLRAYAVSVDLARKIAGSDSDDLMAALNNLGALKSRMGDVNGAIQAQEEALAIAYRLHPDDNHMGVIENNLGSNYLKVQNFDKAKEHLDRAVTMLGKLYGSDSPRLMQVTRNLAKLYTRTGQFPLAWKSFEFSLKNTFEQVDGQATAHALFARSLAEGSSPKRAVDEALASARISREYFVLQARTLPERQALAYDAVRPHGLDISISVVLKHPELGFESTYREVVLSRALVADEMARRQRNLNARNDPETGRLLDALDKARAELLAAERLPTNSPKNADLIVAASAKMEEIERTLAERSAVLRADERIQQATTNDLIQHLPAGSVLVSYVLYRRNAVDTLDPAEIDAPSYVAFVLHPDTGQIRLFDLGKAASLDDLVRQARAAALAESRSGGLGSSRNERAYRTAALGIRRRVWDPLREELSTARLALVVADGNLNLIPFAGLPEGSGYLVEHGPVIHTLSSERDLLTNVQGPANQGLFAIGSPSFKVAENKLQPSPLRGATPTCQDFAKMNFQPLPGSAIEVSDIGSTWRKWNGAEPSRLITGDDATLSKFLEDAPHSRVLHIATHAFLLEKSCGSGNPLLHSGLIFAGGTAAGTQAILTAQQIASLDLGGVDWAVLSACNTGNGELRDGEGVLGLQRAFRVAGAHSVIMTLWPVDDTTARQFMHRLYADRLELHESTADSVWDASRKLLLQRRAAAKSTHPWYWAGFISSGRWE
jgi:CHAT domain-containing protein